MMRTKVIAKQYARLGLLLAVMVGGLLITSVMAAPYFSFEAESGTNTGQTQVVSDTSASGSSALQFTSQSGGGVTIPNPGTWTNVSANLPTIPSECGTIYSMWAQPNSSKVHAGISRSAIWQTTTGVGNWSKLGTGTIVLDHRPTQIIYDPVNPNTFWVSGIWPGNGAAVYKTTDGGATFQQLGNLAAVGGGRGSDGMSVDFSDPNRQLILAGAHEETNSVFKSTNGGQTWTNIGANIPVETRFTTAPLIVNSQTYLTNSTSWGGDPAGAGIWRTTNGGSTWTRVSTLAPAFPPAVGPDGTIYWSHGDQLARSTDGGATWTEVGSGLRNETSPIVLPDGRVVAIGEAGRLRISSDRGQTFTDFGATMPIRPWHVAYSSGQDAFYISEWTCDDRVLSNGVWRLK